jgi:hypothetical protein
MKVEATLNVRINGHLVSCIHVDPNCLEIHYSRQADPTVKVSHDSACQCGGPPKTVRFDSEISQRDASMYQLGFDDGGVYFRNPFPEDRDRPYSWQCAECKDHGTNETEESARQSLLDHLTATHPRENSGIYHPSPEPRG